MKSLNGAAVVAAWGALAVGGIVNGQSIWTVCPDGSCDFTDVQAAVDASQSGDTILLHSGTYAPFQIVGKALTIEGTGDDVVIDGLHSSRVITSPTRPSRTASSSAAW